METISGVNPLEDIPPNGEFKRFLSNEPCIEISDGKEFEHQGIVSIKNIVENGQNTLWVNVDTGGRDVDGSLYFDTMLFDDVFQPTDDKSVWFGSDGEDSFTLTYYGTYLELIETSDNPHFQNMSGLYSLLG